MQTMQWSNKMGSRGRGAFLLFVRGDEIIPFAGSNIPGVVVVSGTDYTQNGKWSHTTYRLQVADGIRYIAGRDGWESGRFVEGLGHSVGCRTPDTWKETAMAFGVSVPSAMKFLQDWRPKAAAKLDETEQSLIDLEESSNQNETDSIIVTVGFGAPTLKEIKNGYWENPKPVKGYKAEIRLKDRNTGGWTEGNIKLVGISGQVLSVNHRRGVHGGYYAVSVAVMPGTETEIPPFETAREKAAKESGLPDGLFHAFNGDQEKIHEFMRNVENLNADKIDQHKLFVCGRSSKEAEIVRVSGNQNFFLGADPLDVCWYIQEIHFPVKHEASSLPTVSSLNGGGNTAFADALRKAGL